MRAWCADSFWITRDCSGDKIKSLKSQLYYQLLGIATYYQYVRGCHMRREVAPGACVGSDLAQGMDMCGLVMQITYFQ